MPETRAFSERQLAVRWGVSERTIRRIVAAGGLAPVTIGQRSVRFMSPDVEAYEASRRVA